MGTGISGATLLSASARGLRRPSGDLGFRAAAAHRADDSSRVELTPDHLTARDTGGVPTGDSIGAPALGGWRQSSPGTATAAAWLRNARGATVWLTGLPSAGKTTIARAVEERLRAGGRRVEVLDGDEIREFLSTGLGFSREDRDTHVRRVGMVAEVLARNGVLVLVPVIAPYAHTRAAVRLRHDLAPTPYLEVHVATPVEVCSARDVKGLYAKQAAGELSGLTGVDDPYEAPEAPDLRIEAHRQNVSESAAALYALLDEKGLT